MKFKSVLYQEGNFINAEQLFEDMENFCKNEKERYNLEKLHRYHPIQHILNSTSGNYISPTAMKSFMNCPANYLFSKLVPQDTSSILSIGTTFHEIMEKWYNLNGEERTEENIYKIADEQIVLNKQGESEKKDIYKYIDGYLKSPDYEGSGIFDHKNLNCTTELFLKPEIKPLGVDLEVPVYTKIDRVDIRDSGIYIIDYKTGFGDPNSWMANNYLSQGIFYKWVVEETYGQEISGMYLSLPGADTNKLKYYKLNVNSLVEQSKVIESIKGYLNYAQRVRYKTLKFPCTEMRYCRSCPYGFNCPIFAKKYGLDRSAKSPITIEIDVKDEPYTDED